MESFVFIAGVAAVVFIATNIDDLFVLLAFFADGRTRPRDIVIGQYAGIAALYAVSALAALISIAIPASYVGLLGIVPIGLGASRLRALWRARGVSAQARSPTHVPTSGALSVASVTIANGGDNIAAYAPLFATRSGADVVVAGLVFAFLTGVWCLAARWIVGRALVGERIRRYGERAAPVVFIGLGLLILYNAGSFALLRS